MSNTGCKTKPCGCEDKGLTTPTPCAHDTPECPSPQPCAEVFSACCSVYDQDSIVDVGINKGDTLCTVIQKLALFMVNPTCALPTATCKAVIGVQSVNVSSTTIGVVWALNGPAPSFFQVEYKAATSLTWLANPQLANTALSDVIGGLTPDTYYHIRVRSVCQPQNGPVQVCYSLTILVKTNQ